MKPWFWEFAHDNLPYDIVVAEDAVDASGRYSEYHDIGHLVGYEPRRMSLEEVKAAHTCIPIVHDAAEGIAKEDDQWTCAQWLEVLAPEPDLKQVELPFFRPQGGVGPRKKRKGPNYSPPNLKALL